ncbi:hypothetical protein [Ktedonobacter robiniae]|uniref:HAMP domain-containing protein n=1 Tax=Ktedonobacter robiniae TaxID=2778365 RepID=A0ABQ3UX75_9CHLR|nr:hypothetical protein [Ktedonobacter robiniae]GHO57358.1 hypothetical protein KSB_58330 [Ktedonobacter robiniae]
MNTISNHPWSPGELIETQQDAPSKGLFQWWYSLTALPDASVTASVVQREAIRKSRLISVIVACLLISFTAFIPGCLALPNHYVIVADLGMMPFCIIALILNKTQKPTLAGVLLTVAFELALMLVILTSTPFDEPSLQQYELFVFGELLAVSLITPASVFAVGLFNVGFISWSLVFQAPKDPHLIAVLQTQFAPIWIRPVAVQFLVAGVTYLWVISATKAIARANQAEMIAKLEHEMADQKRSLEAGIQQILQTHVQVANGHFNARAPLTQDNVLWQIAQALNNLLIRFQRAVQAERELKRLEEAISASVGSIQQADLDKQTPVLQPTRTSLDRMIAVLQGRTLGKASAYPNQPANRIAPPQSNHGDWPQLRPWRDSIMSQTSNTPDMDS